LYFLETKIGGQQNMLGWVNHLYTAYMGKSFATADMKASFIKYFTEKGTDKAILDSIDWNTWLTSPGLPPFDPSASLANELTATCDALAEKWLKHGGEGCTAADLDKFSSKQKMYFLDVIITNGLPLNHQTLEKIDTLYGLSKTRNVEIACRYIVIGLKSNYEPAKPLAKEFLSIHGRGLYVRPLFRALNEFDHAYAVEVYRINRSRFHAIIRNMFDGLLL
jgi:leukotriene-A4 hydrolase